MRSYRDPTALSRAISEEYLTASEEGRTDLAMSLAWSFAALLARTGPAEGHRLDLLHNNIDPERQKVPGQVASGRKEGWGAVPGRNPATVPAATEAGLGTGTVEPAAGPAESRLVAAGRPLPASTACRSG